MNNLEFIHSFGFDSPNDWFQTNGIIKDRIQSWNFPSLTLMNKLFDYFLFINWFDIFCSPIYDIDVPFNHIIYVSM